MINFETIRNYCRLLPGLWRLASVRYPKKYVFLQNWTSLGGSAVERESWIINFTCNKRVLHIGFLDSPFTAERVAKGQLLHLKLRNSAAYVFGVDIDNKALDLYRKTTKDYENACLDISAATEGHFKQEFDVILFGEVLEHLVEPFAALKNLRLICLSNRGCELCVTVPNAYSLAAFVACLNGEELVHR